MSGGSRSTEARRFRNALPRSGSILKARKLEQGTGGSHVPARQIQERRGKETGGSLEQLRGRHPGEGWGLHEDSSSRMERLV